MLIFPSDVNKGQCLSIMTSSNPKREGESQRAGAGDGGERDKEGERGREGDGEILCT